MHAAALAEDPSVFDYDGVYDTMQETKSAPVAAARASRGSKYIESLLDKAQQRQREQDIMYERRCGLHSPVWLATGKACYRKPHQQVFHYLLTSVRRLHVRSTCPLSVRIHRREPLSPTQPTCLQRNHLGWPQAPVDG